MNECAPDPATVERWLALCLEAQDGNHTAMAQLLDEVRPFLKGVAQKQLRGQAFGAWDASDVAQDCCLKLEDQLHTFRGTTGQALIAWLRTMARREFLDTVRYGNTQSRAPNQRINPLPGDSSGGEVSPTDTSTPSQQAMRNEEQKLVEEALGRLSSDYQQVIRLRLSPDKLTWAAIAQQMSRSEDAIKKLHQRALEQLTIQLRGQP
jgi:RNA polymerase sigma-70 factor (subfamily 1)